MAFQWLTPDRQTAEIHICILLGLSLTGGFCPLSHERFSALGNAEIARVA
jgi:hypothetical protein